MPPDPARSSALRASLLPLRGNYISHSIQTKNLGIYGAVAESMLRILQQVLFQICNNNITTSTARNGFHSAKVCHALQICQVIKITQAYSRNVDCTCLETC